jgi:hypothetical protein
VSVAKSAPRPGSVYAPRTGKGPRRAVSAIEHICQRAYYVHYSPVRKDGSLGSARKCWCATWESWAGDEVEE